jgi:two-component system, OmpR family, sensor histidine kinase KdpD
MRFDLIEPAARQSSPVLRATAFAGALVAVAAATVVGLLIVERWGTEPVVLLYIPAVLAAAVYAGLWPALLAAVASALAYNYYFTAPYRTFVIHSPADIVTVVMLFLVAVVTSQLVSKLREQAQLAEAHAARNATIAGFAPKLLSCRDTAAIGEATVQELAQLFHCHAVFMTGEDGPQPLASAPESAALAPSDFAAAAVTLNTGAPTGRGVRKLDLADWQFQPIVAGSGVMATVGMARDNGVPPVAATQSALLGNLLDQVALALERAQLERDARDVAALLERDRLRSALLTSIGEDVKPRLNSIGTAARALKRAGAGDKTLIASVSSEVGKLDRYVESLVDLAPGSEQAPLAVGSLTIDLHQRMVRREGEEVHLTPKEYALLVELAKHAGRVLTHAHLLRAVWGPAQAEQVEYLRVAIRALRQKLEVDPAHPALIVNEPAVGYRLNAS